MARPGINGTVEVRRSLSFGLLYFFIASLFRLRLQPQFLFPLAARDFLFAVPMESSFVPVYS